MIIHNGAVPGMLSEFMDLPFINACTAFNFNGTNANMEREIEGGKEYVSASLPLIIAAKGLVEESDLIIPNMERYYDARTKPLTIKQTAKKI